MVVEPSAGPSSASEDSKENLAEMGPEAPDSFSRKFYHGVPVSGEFLIGI